MLDVACGNGPLADRVGGWIGLDASTAELTVAARAGRGPLLRSRAGRLPIATGSACAVACSMALQIIQPLGATVAEIARVLHAGGRAVCCYPHRGRCRCVTRCCTCVCRRRSEAGSAIRTIGRSPVRTWPPPPRHAGCGSLPTSSEPSPCWSAPLPTADELVQSLYLPGTSERQRHRAARVLRRRVGSGLVIPLRRVVLDRVG